MVKLICMLASNKTKQDKRITTTMTVNNNKKRKRKGMGWDR